jgi:hypothetical protein
LRFLLLYSPGWMFLLPGCVMLVAGLVGGSLTVTGAQRIGAIGLDTGTLFVSSLLVLSGVQLIISWAAAKAFATSIGLLPRTPSLETWLKRLSLERGVVLGIVFFLGGAVGLVVALLRWRHSGYGQLNATALMRLLVPSATGILLGMQLVLGSFLVGISMIKRLDRGPAFIDDSSVDAGAVAR